MNHGINHEHLADFPGNFCVSTMRLHAPHALTPNFRANKPEGLSAFFLSVEVNIAAFVRGYKWNDIDFQLNTWEFLSLAVEAPIFTEKFQIYLADSILYSTPKRHIGPGKLTNLMI
jgi:hypothetical protein